MSDLQRFIDAQNYNYQSALEEIKTVEKQAAGCGMYFHRYAGLGTAK